MKRSLLLVAGLIIIYQVYSQENNREVGAPKNATDNGRPYAMVAGGSKGIGYAVAEALAKRKFNLILIARHLDGLLTAKNKLESYGVHVEVLVYDLAYENAAPEIAKWCTDRDIPLKMLCNIAGLG